MKKKKKKRGEGVLCFGFVVVVGVFHLERVVVGVFIRESVSFMHQF